MEQIFLNGISIKEFLGHLERLIETKIQPDKDAKVLSNNSFLSRSEVAKMLKISLVTLHSWTAKGILKSYKIGARVLYKHEDIYEAIENTVLRRVRRK